MINKSFIKVKTSWGHDVYNLFLTQAPRSDSIVILFPGAGYSCESPLLYYAREAALQAGCDVLSLEYGYFKTDNSFKLEYLEQIIQEAYEVIQTVLSNLYRRIFFISKSLGTSVAGKISELLGYDKINNLFLTPTSNTIPYIIKSRCAVIVGTNDKFFSKENINFIRTYSSVNLHIIDDATHSLKVDDDCMKSIEILKDVTQLCMSFVCRK